MTINKKLLLTVTSLAAIGVILYFTRKTRIDRIERERILDQVADEGYETAFDIISPLRSHQLRYRVR